MAIRWADSQFGFWSCIALIEQDVSRQLLETRLQQAVELMRSKKQPGLIWLFEDLLDPAARDALPETIEQAGLTLALAGFGMAGDILPIPEPHHPELRFVRVTTEEQLLAYADINARAYGMPLEAARDGLQGSALWKQGIHAYLALENDVPVSCAASVAVDGRLFVALVATNPDAQRKGYGEAVTRKALHEGAKATGLTRAILHATMAGAPVYERIGLHKTSSVHFYELKV
ncbi:GNAT family N-acetyltransferase [Janthinobacterium agaricidamnosum]|nr:GNAT family N-acetyltransferase [Janthinobacterium agaricidamnosum]